MMPVSTMVMPATRILRGVSGRAQARSPQTAAAPTTVPPRMMPLSFMNTSTTMPAIRAGTAVQRKSRSRQAIRTNHGVTPNSSTSPPL